MRATVRIIAAVLLLSAGIIATGASPAHHAAASTAGFNCPVFPGYRETCVEGIVVPEGASVFVTRYNDGWEGCTFYLVGHVYGGAYGSGYVAAGQTGHIGYNPPPGASTFDVEVSCGTNYNSPSGYVSY